MQEDVVANATVLALPLTGSQGCGRMRGLHPGGTEGGKFKPLLGHITLQMSVMHRTAPRTPRAAHGDCQKTQGSSREDMGRTCRAGLAMCIGREAAAKSDAECSTQSTRCAPRAGSHCSNPGSLAGAPGSGSRGPGIQPHLLLPASPSATTMPPVIFSLSFSNE